MAEELTEVGRRMSRKHCRRKHYPLVNPVDCAIAGAAITDTARLDKLRMLELSALEAFRTGRATPDDWRALADCVNVAETMALEGIGPEVIEPCRQASEALGIAHLRYKQRGKLGLSGIELQALRELHEFHDLQRTSISRSEYERAIKKTGDRIRSAHPSVKVYC